MEEQKKMVAVIGAGPAGLFAARYLNNSGVRVALFNRDIKPGGLAEYGVYLDKIKMKEGLRKQFNQILSSPGVDYFGNVKVSSGGTLILPDLIEKGFQSIVIATGAQGTKWLRLRGENLPGVYHAKDLVFKYNLLPPYSLRRNLIGPKVILVGAGNVMMDIAHFLTREKKVEEITIIMRRGPGEVKFSRKELENVVANIDMVSLEAEFSRVAPILKAVWQDIDVSRRFFLDGLPNALKPISETKLRFEFLVSPVSILGDWTRGASALIVEDNTLIAENGNVKSRGLGSTRQIGANTVIFAIGDTVDKDFSLPIKGDAYSVNPNQSFPVDGISFEAFDMDADAPIKAVFLAGWARQASSGLVGVARKDGENAAKAVLQYLQTLPPMNDLEKTYTNFTNWLHTNFKQVVTKDNLGRLHASEQAEKQARGVEDFKFATNEEMLRNMRL